jgi:hypothetical protein
VNRAGPCRFRLAGFAILCLASIALARAEEARPEGKSFLWKIRSETATAYLLGSIHLLKRDMYPLDGKIEEAFDRSGVLVVEADVRGEAGGERQRRMLEGAMYPPGDTIGNHISKDTIDLLMRRFPQLSLDRVDRIRPWALAMTIAVMEHQRMGLDYNHGIDVYFLGKAADEKRIREIEGTDTVIALLNGFSDEEQDLFLQYTLLDLDEIGTKTDRILRAWNAGDAAAMEEIISESLGKRARLLPVFDALFYRRNEKMAEKIEGYLKEEGQFFIVVGAGHLVGEKGIVERLRRKGFPVEQQ